MRGVPKQLLLVWLAGPLALVGGPLECAVFAHPVPDSRAVLNVHPTGTFKLRIVCDVAALVMQSMPGHLGTAAEELRALGAEELQARIEDAKQATQYYLQVRFDGVLQSPQEIRFPALAVIRAGNSHGGEAAWPEIELQGNWPPGAQTCEISFPPALGRVQFKLEREDQTLLTRELAAGRSSGALSLQTGAATQSSRHARAEWAGWILVALLLAYLCRLYLKRPRIYSRSTNTGQ